MTLGNLPDLAQALAALRDAATAVAARRPGWEAAPTLDKAVGRRLAALRARYPLPMPLAGLKDAIRSECERWQRESPAAARDVALRLTAIETARTIASRCRALAANLEERPRKPARPQERL